MSWWTGPAEMDVIRRLRRKFILMAFIAVVIILTGALGLINTIGYMKMRSEVDYMVNAISENGGLLPQTQPTAGESWLEDPDWYDDTPEFAHQIRYFSAVTDSKGQIRRLNLSNISAFTEVEALETAKQLADGARERGLFKRSRASYAFSVRKAADGSKIVVVLDCTRDVASVEGFMRYSLHFGLICVLLYMGILLILCNWAIRPFVENMDNQKRFITNAGHELKTPVAIISANAEAMELLNGKSQWTDNILFQVKRVTRLINELIMLAKMGEKAQQNLEKAPVDISKVFHDAVEAFAPLVEGEGKNLVQEIPEGISAVSNEKYLYEVFTIFMDNAAKYCDTRGTITAALTGSKGHFTASVSNSYKNGSSTDYTHFFERFYRGDESHNSSRQGYGIGLSMAQEAVRLLGGKILVHFKDGVITFGVKF